MGFLFRRSGVDSLDVDDESPLFWSCRFVCSEVTGLLPTFQFIFCVNPSKGALVLELDSDVCFPFILLEMYPNVFEFFL